MGSYQYGLHCRPTANWFGLQCNLHIRRPINEICSSHTHSTTSNADAREAARLYINYIFPHHGLGKSIVSDRDPKFTSAFFQEVFTILGTQLCPSTANHPQTDGRAERIYRVVGDTLRTFVISFICHSFVTSRFTSEFGSWEFQGWPHPVD